MTAVSGSGQLRRCAVLAVFAHPDDESLACGGLLARCAAEGAHVTVLCITRGELGSLPAGESGQSLAALRVRELEAAGRVLGVAAVTCLDYEDGCVPWADVSRIEADIALAIRETAAEAVITFDEDGLYWHPDHIAVHARTTAAVAALGDAAPALYYATVPHGRMGALQALVAARRPHRPGPHHILGVLDGEAFGAMAPSPSLAIDVTAFVPQKLAALRCHASQVAGGVFDGLCDEDAASVLGLEQLRRATVGSAAPTMIDALGMTGSRVGVPASRLSATVPEAGP